MTDLSTRVGAVELASPVMTASGTAGHGVELAAYLDLSSLGAVVVKSLAAFEWPGNPAPRVHPAGIGMINAVGLQGPGVERWLEHDLPPLAATGARVVASIWGRTVDDYHRAAAQLSVAPAEVVAVEVNLSCPNLEGRRGIFAHDEALSRAVIEGCAAELRRPVWAKLSPNTDRVVEIAAAVVGAGAAAVTLINTVLGMALDPHTGRPALGAGGGGLSGAGVHPIAVRAVYDVRAAHPDVAIVGVGGVSTGWDAIELLLAGASAIQVGTATFADPRAPRRVAAEIDRWCVERGVERVADLVGLAHRGGMP